MKKNEMPVDLIFTALSEETEKIKEHAKKASDILLGPLDTKIAQTPYEIVYTEDRVKLKHYRPITRNRLHTPLLVVFGLVNRETVLDLQPGRSVIQNFLKKGINLYVIDWGYPTGIDKYLTIDDHVNGYLDNIVDFILQKHGLSKINLMGICMGGTFCVIYSALYPDKVKNLITTGAPTRFDINKGLLHIWIREVDVDRMMNAFGNIPGAFLNAGFLLLNPARLIINKYFGFWENADNKEFVENFFRMERWIFDSPDIPGETFREFIKDCYQKNLLIQSKMQVGGKRVDLKNITMPLLNIYSRYDHLVPPEACELLTRSVGSKDTEDVCLNTGHIGIYVGASCQKELVPKITGWLKDRDEIKKEAYSYKKRTAEINPRKYFKALI